MRFQLFSKAIWIRVLKDEQGVSMVEYAVAGGFVAAVVAASYTPLGSAVTSQINAVISAMG
mgnify:CR=1 FL=1